MINAKNANFERKFIKNTKNVNWKNFANIIAEKKVEQIIKFHELKIRKKNESFKNERHKRIKCNNLKKTADQHDRNNVKIINLNKSQWTNL